MRPVPPVGRVFFPLDEELKLVAGTFTPSLVEGIVRLGTWMPFGAVPAGIAYFCKVSLSEPTARRKTEEAGQAYVEVQTAQVEALERAESAPPSGPPLQQISVDGALVPLLHKQWGEVKTLAIGVIGPPVQEQGEWHVHAEQLSYFSRMTDHETFARLATAETHRRGTETATTVCAVNDGAEWEQKFVDYHRSDAVRILDGGHGAEHVSDVGRAVFGRATPAEESWRTAQLRALKQDDPPSLVAELERLRQALVTGEQLGTEAAALDTVEANLEYFTKRREQIRYAAFAQAGYPIGSGAVESGNKLVVEARLKGAGMHWAPAHVNPMVALRTVACSDTWEEAWPQITTRVRERTKERAQRRRTARQTAPAALGPIHNLVGLPPPKGSVVLRPAERAATPEAKTEPAPPMAGPRKPAADHPWRHQPIGKARYSDSRLLAG